MDETVEQNPGAPAPAIRLDMIGIATADMAASLAFYRRLGLRIPDGMDDEPHVEAVLPGGIRVGWDPVKPEAGTAGGGGIALAFLCGSPAAVDACHAELTADGVPSEAAPYDAPWGQRYATVRDPDGNYIDLFAPLG